MRGARSGGLGSCCCCMPHAAPAACLLRFYNLYAALCLLWAAVLQLINYLTDKPGVARVCTIPIRLAQYLR
jgi:hypothetical protein